MTFIHAFILGVVEGVTEFLPISSTAHLSLVSLALGLPQSEFLKSFEIIIQSGAIIGILPVLFPFLRKAFPWKQIIVALIPTMVVGFALYKVIKGFLLGNTIVIACALLLGGIIMLLAERQYHPKNTDTEVHIETFSLKRSFLLGLVQALAVIPGVSRSGAVSIAGLYMQISRAQIVAFSFMLGAPTIFLASAYDLYKTGIDFSHHEWQLLAFGFAISALVTYFVGKWFFSYIQKANFKLFGWYRIVLGIVILAITVL